MIHVLRHIHRRARQEWDEHYTIIALFCIALISACVYLVHVICEEWKWLSR